MEQGPVPNAGAVDRSTHGLPERHSVPNRATALDCGAACHINTGRKMPKERSGGCFLALPQNHKRDRGLKILKDKKNQSQ